MDKVFGEHLKCTNPTILGQLGYSLEFTSYKNPIFLSTLIGPYPKNH